MQTPKTPLTRITAVLMTALLGTAASAADYRAGVASTIITPAEPTWMGGYAARTQPADSKIHDLHATALAIQDAAGYTVVIVSIETPHLTRELADAVAGTLQQRLQLRREQIVIACTHTHCGPALFGSTARLSYAINSEQMAASRRYAETLKNKMVDVATKAIGALAPAELSHGIGRCGFAVNRRNNREADTTKEGFVPVGPVDHDVPVLCVRSDGKVRAVLFGYACHCTTLSIMQWCGDYAGFARAYLQEMHPGATALFVPGCGADSNPLPRRSLELCRNYGRQLADAVQAVLTEPMPPVRGPIQAAWRQIDLRYDIPSRSEVKQMASGGQRVQARWAQHMLERLDAGESLPSSYPIPLQVIRFGDDLAAAFLAGEAVVDYSLRLKRELGLKRTWVFAYANDMCGYIPSERVLAEGGYEGRDAAFHSSRPGPWATGLEQQIVTTIRTMVEQLQEPAAP